MAFLRGLRDPFEGREKPTPSRSRPATEVRGTPLPSRNEFVTEADQGSVPGAAVGLRARAVVQANAAVHGLEPERSTTLADRALDVMPPDPAAHGEREVGLDVAVHRRGAHFRARVLGQA